MQKTKQLFSVNFPCIYYPHLINMSAAKYRKSIDIEKEDTNKKRKLAQRKNMWDRLQWRKIDTSSFNLDDGKQGDEDTGEGVLFELEEISGDQYMLIKGSNNSAGFQVASKNPVTINNQDKNDDNRPLEPSIYESTAVSKSAKQNTDKKAKQKKAKKVKNSMKNRANCEEQLEKESVESMANLPWDEKGKIMLHSLLVDALNKLKFQTPTPIQAAALPITLQFEKDASGNETFCDIVGAAETGSGKTLAFVLPILHSILRGWGANSTQACNDHNRKCPYALIISPTRELAMQITTVANDLCSVFKQSARIEVVSIVGGMAEQKQRRQLCGNRPVHIVVATPGRLCELLLEEELAVFQDLSGLRFLVVDEADRIVEEGHFAELHRVFSRIRDHEKRAAQGPVEVEEDRGWNEEPEILEGDEADNADEIACPPMPTEEDMERAKVEAAELEPVADQEVEEEEVRMEPAREYRLIRQTLLFSATAIQSMDQQGRSADKVLGWKASKKASARATKLNGTLKGVGSNSTLPAHLKQLLSLVGVQPTIHVVDVSTLSAAVSKANPADNATGPSPTNARQILPQGLSQLEVKIPTEDKDVFAYYYLLTHPGRCLVFVNSIKTARRVDGLLRALGLNCRSIHAQLQQKQRLNALDSFKSAPVGILVATDVAARGLDIPKIQAVLHYDIARSPQVYIHRSGRTARANQIGTAVSLVSPEDASAHQDICDYLRPSNADRDGKPHFPLLPADLALLPLLRERVKLAKKIFTQSFVLSQGSKERLWTTQSAEAADLELDEYSQQELGIDQTDAAHENSKKVQQMRNQLKMLLAEPLPTDSSKLGSGFNTADVSSSSSGKKKRSNKQQLAISGANLRKGKGRGLFVFAK